MGLGKHHYNAMTTAYHKDHLMSQAKRNNLAWSEDKHEGVNWMRFSNALTRHLDEGKDYHIDDVNPEHLNSMINTYTQLRDLHKQTMIPHIRSAMHKLHSDRGCSDIQPIDLLHDAYGHLEANGGRMWADKVNTLSHYNKHLKKLNERLNNMSEIKPVE